MDSFGTYKTTEEDEVSEMPEDMEKDVTTETTDGSLSTRMSETSDDATVDLSSTSESHLLEESFSSMHKVPKDLLNLPGRRIKAENFDWGLSPVMPLADIIIEAAADIKSENLESFLKSATDEQRTRIFKLLPLDFPLKLTLPIIDEGIYWERLCLRYWPAWDVWHYSDNWKCMFVHRSVQEIIEKFIPGKNDIENLIKNLEVFSEYVTSLKIQKLVKYTPEKIDIDIFLEDFDQYLDEIIASKISPNYLDFEKVFDCLPNLKHLTISLSPSCIDLENFNFNNADLNCLVRATKKLNKLEKFRLSNGNFSNEQISKFLPIFCKHEALSELNFSFNFIDDTTCYMIAKLLLGNNYLKNLILKYNKITDKGAKIIASVLCSESQMEKLDLSLNMIGNDGATTIANVLLRNESLVDLDLSKNKITEEGGIPFAELVKKSKTLRCLKLQENFLGEKVGKMLAVAIKENDCLLELEVHFCGFRSEDEGQIHRSILQNRSKVPYIAAGKMNHDIFASKFLF